MLLGSPDMPAIMSVLAEARTELELNAFEFFSESALEKVVSTRHLQRPFETSAAYHALLEFECADEMTRESATRMVERCMQQGWVLDGVVSQTIAQADSLWRLREDISESIARWTPCKNDISTTVSQVPEFLEEVQALLQERYPEFETVWFGHIGDGNVHLNILRPDGLSAEEFQRQSETMSEGVFRIVERYGGSISAEHGIGLLRKRFLHYSRSALEIALMRQIKRAFDPHGIMNPGKIFD